LIAKHDNPRELYTKKLIERGDINAEVAKAMDKEFRNLLQDRLNMIKEQKLPYKFQPNDKEWEKLRKSTPEDFDKSPNTGITQEVIDKVAKALIETPKSFTPLKQIEKLLKTRKEQFFDTKVLDWAAAELLAYGSMIQDGVKVRLSGQDVQRGTFSHRHAVLTDSETNEKYNSLNAINPNNKFEIYNSHLSEYGVLGFEFGYSWASPNTLPIWEAQFGDFANGAQIMIDQFIVSGETKWNIQNGLVMLLPHGQEGQGPEHSSARLERFLQLCANYNITVTNITTPANIFHALRRQMAWEFRKPMIAMSPKSMLRHPLVLSDLEEFKNGSFQEIIDDIDAKASKVTRVLLCSGKVYYDLLEEQKKGKHEFAAIVRLEQLFPIAEKQLDTILQKYNKATEVIWVQEEPSNSGAWMFILKNLYSKIPNLKVIAKDDSSSPAVGYIGVHKKKQAEIVEKAFKK
jgi:2-oxoglutarate dehydrogenase E1 component